MIIDSLAMLPDMFGFAAHLDGNPKTSTCRMDFQSGIS